MSGCFFLKHGVQSAGRERCHVPPVCSNQVGLLNNRDAPDSNFWKVSRNLMWCRRWCTL